MTLTTEELIKIADTIIDIKNTPPELYETLKKAYPAAAGLVDLCRQVF